MPKHTWWKQTREELGDIAPEDWLRREHAERYDKELAKELSEKLGRRVTRNAIQIKAKRLDLLKSPEFFEAHWDSMRAPRIIVPRFVAHERVEGRATIAGDFQIPLHDTNLVEKMVYVSMKMGSKQLIIPGDFWNFDAFSFFVSEPTYTAGEELDYGEELLRYLMQWFDFILILMGNHEKRLYKGALDKKIDINRLSKMMGAYPERVVYSKYGYCILNNRWRVTHPKNFSQIRNRIANKLALKHRQKIVMFHGHMLSMTHDDSGHELIVDGGGMFDETKHEYRMIEDSTYPAWHRGFWVITEDNEIHGFNDLWTPWNFYEKAWANEKKP